MSTTPTKAVPIDLRTSSSPPTVTSVVILTPMPSASTIRGGVSAAAWNQRNDFQNQPRPKSVTSPAAAIGVTAASTSSEAARATITRVWPIAASHSSIPMMPRMTATVPLVMSLAVNGSQGSHSLQRVTLSSDCMRALVSPLQAATRVTP